MIVVKQALPFLTILSILKIVLMLPMVPDEMNVIADTDQTYVMENANELQQSLGKILFLCSVTSITILLTVFQYNIYNYVFSF